MKVRDLARLRTVLETRRDELEKTVARIQRELPSATFTARSDKLQVIAEVARRQLQSVHEALQRMEAGKYGQCVRCEKEIGELLEVAPWASLCTDCQNGEPTGR